MTYAAGRRILDCDAHIMEPRGWIEQFAPSSIRGRLAPLDAADPGLADLLDRSVEQRDLRASDLGEADAAARDLMAMSRKGWGSLGDNDARERSVALDLLGFDLQLVFPTASFPQVCNSETSVFAEAVAAMNRGLAAFCEDDARLRSVAYVPLRDGPDVALSILERATRDGAAAAMVDMVPSLDGISHSHPSFDPVWSEIAAADLCVMVHVGLDNGYRPVRPSFFANGRNLEHFRSDAPGDALSFMAIGFPAQLFLASMVFDGVFDRNPGLRIGTAELGATWVPSFLHFVDTAVRSFRRTQDLAHLTMAPSEYVRRHCRFSPFAGENIGFMIETAGSELFMFSSDYPHHEGTDDPIGRFERTMPNATEIDRERFYADNFRWLIGSHGLVAT